MKKPLTLAAEVGGALTVLENDLPAETKPRRNTNELVATAKKIERLQAKRRRLRKDLRALEADLRHEMKMLKAMAEWVR